MVLKINKVLCKYGYLIFLFWKKIRTIWNYFELLRLSWESVLLIKYGTIQIQLNGLKATQKHQRDKTKQNPMNYEINLLCNMTMLFSTSRCVFRSNICHLGLPKVINCGVIEGRLGVWCFSKCAIMNFFQVKSHSNLIVIVTPKCKQMQNYAPLSQRQSHWESP